MIDGPSCASASQEGIDGLLRRCAHGNLRNVDVPVRDRHQPEIFLAAALSAGGEFRDRAARRRFRRLAAGVRVDLGVEHEDVDVAARGQHVIQSAVADVVRPSVAADNPDAAAHQVFGQCSQPPRLRRVDRREIASSARHGSLLPDLFLASS